MGRAPLPHQKPWLWVSRLCYVTVLKEIFSHIHTESWFGPQLRKHSRTSITLFIYLCSFLPSGLIFISITNFPEHIFVLLAVHFTAFPESFLGTWQKLQCARWKGLWLRVCFVFAGIWSYGECLWRTRHCCLLTGLHGLRDSYEESHGNSRRLGISPSNGTVSFLPLQHSSSRLFSTMVHDDLWLSLCLALLSFSWCQKKLLPQLLCTMKQFLCPTAVFSSAFQNRVRSSKRLVAENWYNWYTSLERFCGDTRERHPPTCRRT